MADLISMLAACAGGGEKDPDFNQTVLLLHGDGTNGAQNNTFLDSSTNNFTITRNGNTTQGTFSPFSVGAGEWSNYFDGSGDFLAFPDNTAFNFGTGDFTVECWIYRVGTGSGTLVYESVIGGNDGAGVASFWNLYVNSSNNQIAWYGNDTVLRTTSSSISNNSWNHIVVSRVGSTLRIFINGVQGYSATVTTSYSLSAAGGRIGFDGPSNPTSNKHFFGYISNIRVLKGTGYSSITVPTTPLTAITNTSLLTCQSNRFVDNSTNAFAITPNGDVRVTPFSPFAPTAAYSAGTNGGSGYFDGTGDYLTVGATSDWKFLHDGSNWTIEFWAYNTTNDFDAIVSTAAWSALIGLSVYFNLTANCVSVYFSRGVVASEAIFVSSASLKANQWNYVAITFENSGKTCSFYINGATAGSSSDAGFAYSSSNPTKTLAIGRGEGTTSPTPPGAEYTGYIGSLRISTNVRTGLTSVPTAPYTSDANTKLLCNFTNAGIFDNTGKNNLETVGDAQIDTTTKKFGTGSLEFDGTGDWLLLANNPDQQLGTGNFTIEFWVYLASGDTGSARGLVAKGTSTTGWLVSLDSSQKVVFTYTTSTITSSGAITTNAWNYIAVVREGTGSNQTKIYIGGVNDGTGTVSTDFNQTSVMYIGANRTGGDPMKGFIDDLRITKGIARTITVPTAAFPDL